MYRYLKKNIKFWENNNNILCRKYYINSVNLIKRKKLFKRMLKNKLKKYYSIKIKLIQLYKYFLKVLNFSKTTLLYNMVDTND